MKKTKRKNNTFYVIFSSIVMVALLVLSLVFISRNNNNFNKVYELNIEVEQSKKEIKDLEDEIKDLNSKITYINTQLESTKNQLNQEKTDKTNITKELENIKTQLESANNLVASLQSSLETALEEKTVAEDKIVELNKELEKAKKDIASLQVSLQLASNTPSGYLVKYVANGNDVYSEMVSSGGNVANVPSVPEMRGYSGSWNSTGTNITTNTTITAVYTPNTYNIYYHTNLVTDFSLESTLETADFKIFNIVYEVASNSLTIHIKHPLVNKEFTYLGDTFHFNSDYSKVLDSTESEMCSVSNNEFYFYGGSFGLSSDKNYYYVITDVIMDNEHVFEVNDIYYRYDFSTYTLYRLDTKATVDSTLLYTSSSYPGEWYYNPKTKMIDIGGTQSSVTNNTFVHNSETHFIDPKTNRVYIISDDEAEWVSGSTPLTQSTYTYGDDIIIDYSVFKNVCDIISNGNQISSSEAKGTMGARAVSGVYVFASDPNTIVSNGTALFATVKDPIGDIHVYICFGPSWS